MSSDDTSAEIGDDIAAAVDDEAWHEANEALTDARARLAAIPAEVVVVNHAMGLYELAAIHLSSQPPALESARLAIDAVAALVDGLGDRLGDDVGTLREALATLRLAYVQVSAT